MSTENIQLHIDNRFAVNANGIDVFSAAWAFNPNNYWANFAYALDIRS